MLKLYIGDNVADLPENVSIRISRSNPAYLGEDVDVIKSTFSYPFDLPLTARNRSLLSYPDRLDNAMPLPQELPARLVAGPDTILIGRVNCLSATRQTAKVYFVNNPLGDLAKVNMNEVDIGKFVYSSFSALLANMKDTTVNPLDRPYITFPVQNQLAKGDNNDNPDGAIQNTYDFTTGGFKGGFPVSLFLRAEYVLKSLIEANSFSWTDLFHTSDEHKRITLVNNRSLRREDGSYVTTGDYNMFLPETSVSEFLKQYCRVFCLAPFADLSGSSLTLQPLSPLVGRPPEKEWTAYASHDYMRTKKGAGIKKITYSEAAYSPGKIGVEFKDLGGPDIAANSFPDSADPLRLYYNNSTATYGRFLFLPNPTNAGTFTRGFGAHENVRGEEVVAPTLYPLQNVLITNLSLGGDKILQPIWSREMAGPVTPYNDAEESSPDVEVALAIYRGLQRTTTNRIYPLGDFNNFDSNRNPIDGEKLSLRIPGENGLYEYAWREWDTMLQDTSVVEHTFLLPLSELIGFDFRDKVRVQNRNYFVREMEFELSSGGVSPTSCTLVSVS